MTGTNPDLLKIDPSSSKQSSIHILTEIQSYGILLVLQEPSLTVLQVSNNTMGVFGVTPGQMLGQPLEKFLDALQVEKFRASLTDPSFNRSNYTKVSVLKSQDNYSVFDAVFHHNPDGHLILELEPTQKDEHIPFQSFYHLAKASMIPLVSSPTNQEKGFTEGRSAITPDLPAFGRIMVAEVRKLTEFDRVMLYKFDDDGHGEVIAEDKVMAMESYLGLHFPESDIPQPAREMFLSNRIRAISDVHDDAVQLIPTHNPLTRQPTDLSRSMLRSPDPCHAEYLQNMGVSASLTISLIKDGRLWGIITCHHQTAKFISYELRNACELLGQVIFDRISIIEDIPDYSYRSKLAHLQSMGIEQMLQGETSSTASFVDALIGQSPNLLDLFDAWGAAICFGGQWTAVGQTPSPEALDDLVQWLTENVRDDVFTTNSLPLLAVDRVIGAQFKDVASGLLAIYLSPYSYVLCFRPEVIQTVNWGGKQDLAYEEVVKANGHVRLSPRKSFQLWQEQVQLHALPWRPVEIAIAIELRRSLVNIILHQSEAALQQSEQRLRAIFDGTFELIGLLNAEGVLLEINRTALLAVGATANEVIGRAFWTTPWWTYSSTDLQVQIQQAIAQAATGQLVRFETNPVLADGTHIWIDFSITPIFDPPGKVVMLIAEGHDINQQKQTENSLRESEARYRTLVATAPVGIFQTDVSGNCLFINQQCLELMGASHAEVLGHNWANSVHPDDRARVSTEWDRMVQTAPLEQGISQRGFGLEYRLMTPQGQVNWVSGNAIAIASAIDDQAGHITGYLGTVTNITEKKQLEQQFLRVQRLESLGTLASGIAHDLNNVLTPIVGAAELLPLTLPTLDDRSQKLLTMLVESSLRGSNLVKQILAFARGMDGQRIVLQVHHILAEIISVARQTFPKSIKIALDLPADDLWMVYVDATQIHQVLMNLFVNARDAMPNGGSITTTAKNLVLNDTDAKLPVDVRARSYVVITVADTGVGIDHETIDQIFDLFFTTKEIGTGLGLSTVLSIIKAHDGFIDVDSEVGKGTCFKIYLPAVNNCEEQQPVEQPELFDGNEQLILVVDDEFSIREIIKDSLETYNYRVMLASDGVEAIALYEREWDRIAVVLLDMMMPNLHTSHIIQALQQINPAVKIVTMSGTSANESIVEQYALRAFLTKPFTTTEMLHTLANLKLN
jgi:PAS domain S-box-containing protein